METARLGELNFACTCPLCRIRPPDPWALTPDPVFICNPSGVATSDRDPIPRIITRQGYLLEMTFVKLSTLEKVTYTPIEDGKLPGGNVGRPDKQPKTFDKQLQSIQYKDSFFFRLAIQYSRGGSVVSYTVTYYRWKRRVVQLAGLGCAGKLCQLLCGTQFWHFLCDFAWQTTCIHTHWNWGEISELMKWKFTKLDYPPPSKWRLQNSAYRLMTYIIPLP